MSEIVRPRISNEDVVPIVRSKAFETADPSSRFAVGVIAIGDWVRDPAIMDGYHKLRARVYVDQTDMLTKDHIDDDGGERDDDDPRSIHIGILARKGRRNSNKQAFVGCMRLIIRNDGQPLPIERHFPELFKDGGAPEFSTEISRYISRGSIDTRSALRSPTFELASALITAHKLGPTYAIIEPFLERQLRIVGIPFERLADPVFVAAYNEYNLPIRIDVDAIADRFIENDPDTFNAMMYGQEDYTYFGLRARTPPARRLDSVLPYMTDVSEPSRAAVRALTMSLRSTSPRIGMNV